MNKIYFQRLTLPLLFGLFWLGVSPLSSLAQTGPGGVGNSNSNKIWLDASALTGLSNGASASTWTDRSGNGWHANQTSVGNLPSFLSNALNGKPAIHFDRSSTVQYLDITSVGIGAVMSNSNTIFAVARANSGASTSTKNDYQSILVAPSHHSGLLWGGVTTASNLYYAQTTWPGPIYLANSSPITQGNWYIATRKVTENEIGSSLEGQVNGTFVSNGTSSSTQQMYNYNNLVRIGAGYTSGDWTYPLNGDIAEIILYNTTLNDAQRIIVDNYLSAKYNLPIANDYYTSQDPAYTQDVQGIGTTDGTAAHKHAQAGNGKGLLMAELNGSLNAANEFLLAGHASPTNALVSSDLPSGTTQRWQRAWYLEKRGSVEAKLSFDISEAGLTEMVQPANSYRLLYRSSNSGNFTEVSSNGAALLPTIENGDQLTFVLSNALLATGYYTLGEASTLVETVAQTGPGGVGNSSSNKVWLDASALTGLSNGASVSTWTDRSGNGWNANQTSAGNRPTFLSNALNGKPVLHFDRTTAIQSLAITNVGAGNLMSNSNTLIAVTRTVGAGSDNVKEMHQAVIVAPVWNSGITFYGYPNTTHFSLMQWLGGTSNSTNLTQGIALYSPVAKDTWYLVDQLHQETPASTTMTAFSNGVSMGTSSNTQPMTERSSQNLIHIGRAHVSPPYTWGLNGDIAEIILYNTNLNDAQRIIVDNYLSAKYNLSVANDYYTAHDPAYTQDVQGIGTTDGTAAHKHAQASNGKGMLLAELNGSLNAVNEFLMAGHHASGNAWTGSELSGKLTKRWQRTWYVQKTGSIDAKLSFDFSEGGVAPETNFTDQLNRYRLLYAASPAGPFSVVTDGSAALIPTLENGDQLAFAVPDGATGGVNLASGYYTLGLEDPALTPIALQPDVNMNYVTTNTVLEPGKTTEADLQNLSVNQLIQTTTYFDGLGRPLQTVATQASPTKQDLVQATQYDAYGKQPKRYLPFTGGNNGHYHSQALLKDGTYTNSDQALFYQNSPDLAHDSQPYSSAIFESSPFSTVTEAGAPGQHWNPTAHNGGGRTVKPSYRTPNSDEVRRWTWDAATGLVSSADFYVGTVWDPEDLPFPPVTSPYIDISEGNLSVSETKDEENHRVLTFTDKLGRTVLKRAELASGDFLDTYSVYDDFGNLRVVIPPQAVEEMRTAGNWSPDAAFLNRWCFTYHYDRRKRLIESRVPGAAPVRTVYNRLDQPVLSQHGNQAGQNQWSFVKYDVKGRPVLTGLYTREASCQTLQDEADAVSRCYESRSTNAATQYYTVDQAYPLLTGTGYELLTASYYDDYDFDNNGVAEAEFDASYGGQFTQVLPAQPLPQPMYGPDGKLTGTRGLPTGARVKVLGTADHWLPTVSFYDADYQPIQTQSINQAGGKDVTTVQLHFNGRVVKSVRYHRNPLDISRPNGLTVSRWSDDDHLGRTLTSYQQINAEPVETMARHRYNELGQLINKKVGGNGSAATTLQSVDFRYNIRGWITALNSADLTANTGDEKPDLFGLEWLYHQSQGGIAPLHPRSDGNITATRWKSGLDNVPRRFDYQYDAMSRLKGADYGSARSGEDYDLSEIIYDKNGNFRSLTRKGLVSGATGTSPVYGVIDQLTYTPGQGNQLGAVSDAAPAKGGTSGDFVDGGLPSSQEYTYDANGNQLTDDNKGIASTVYNHLDLPTAIWYDAAGGNRLEYTYDAGGSRLQKRLYQGGSLVSTTDYVGGLYYVGNQLQFIDTPEGRALPPQVVGGSNFAYEYHFLDQVGNLRMAYRAGSSSSYTATMETAQAAQEGSWFSNMERQVFQTDPCEGDKRIALSNSQPLGPMRIVKVSKGDVVSAHVDALYTTPATQNNGSGLSAFLQLNGSNPPGQEGSNSNRPSLSVGILFNPSSPPSTSVPRAYLRLLAYNSAGEVIYDEPVYVNSQDCLGKLATSSYQVAQDGYVRIYLASESDAAAYFDNLTVTHQQAMIVQEHHYDPFGLHLVGIEKEGSYPYQYNGLSEQQADPTGKGYLYETDWRGYDPQLGRFKGIDALAHSMPGINPYQYSYNNPVMFNDPNGLIGVPGFLPVFTVVAPKIVAASQLFGQALIHSVAQLTAATAIQAVASGVGGCCPGPCCPGGQAQGSQSSQAQQQGPAQEARGVNPFGLPVAQKAVEQVVEKTIKRGLGWLVRGASTAATFLTATLYPHDAGVGSAFSNQLTEEQEEYFDQLIRYQLHRELTPQEKADLDILTQIKYPHGRPDPVPLPNLNDKGVANIAKNAKKMSPDEIGEFLGEGKNWHKTSAKSDFLKKFKKELKGDTNADFYIDKTTREVFLKSNKSGNWIKTGQKFE